MELFPAADEEQFEFIKTVIDQSDYYIIISAGRYGSIHPETGLSYTEMEYNYAVETGKPVIRLLHKDPFNELKGRLIEKTARGRSLLEKFRKKMSNQRMVKYWLQEDELGSAIDHGLRHVIKTRPAVGWVRSDAASDRLKIENLELKENLRKLKEQSKVRSTEEVLAYNFPVLRAVASSYLQDLETPEVAIFVEIDNALHDSRFVFMTRLIEQLTSLKGIGVDEAYSIVDAMIFEKLAVIKGDECELTALGVQNIAKTRLRVIVFDS